MRDHLNSRHIPVMFGWCAPLYLRSRGRQHVDGPCFPIGSCEAGWARYHSLSVKWHFGPEHWMKSHDLSFAFEHYFDGGLLNGRVDLKVEPISFPQVIPGFPKQSQVLGHFRDFTGD